MAGRSGILPAQPSLGRRSRFRYSVDTRAREARRKRCSKVCDRGCESAPFRVAIRRGEAGAP